VWFQGPDATPCEIKEILRHGISPTKMTVVTLDADNPHYDEVTAVAGNILLPSPIVWVFHHGWIILGEVPHVDETTPYSVFQPEQTTQVNKVPLGLRTVLYIRFRCR